jgi:hypothetical protein
LKFILLFITFIIAHDKAFAQDHRVNGQLIDYDTREPVPGIVVFLQSKHSGEVIREKTSTDRNGEFTLAYDFLDTVDMIIEKRIDYGMITTVSNIHINKDITISPIPLFEYTGINIWHDYTKKGLRKK